MTAAILAGVDVLSLAAAAAELGLSPSTLRWQIYNGKLAGTKVSGNTWVVSRAELERYRRENQRTIGATAQA